MISALAWIRKGTAKEVPDKFELTEERYAQIMDQATAELEDAREDLEAAKASKKASKKEKKKSKAPSTTTDAGDMMDIDVDMAKFHLSDYDEEEDVDVGPTEDVLDLFMQDVKGLVKTSAAEDPHLQPAAEGEDEDSDAEDLHIRPSDSLVITCKTSEDVSYLEVNLYEEDEDNSYVHHDVMLPTFPLCVEPIGFPFGRPGDEAALGCFAAVGTFEPEIEIWNLDVLDAAYPETILGQAEKQAGKKAGKKSSSSSSKKPNPHRHVDAVMALAWNRAHRNLLLSASADTTVKLWDLATGAAVRSFDHHADKVQAVQWHPTEASRLLSASYDGSIVCFDARSPSEQFVWRGLLAGDVEAARWNPLQPHCFAVSDESGAVLCLDARNAAAGPLFRLQAHAKATTALDWHPSVPDCLLTASADKSFKVWKTTANAPVCVLSREPEVGKLFTASFCPDSTFLLSVAGSRGELRFFNLARNEAIVEAFNN
jgi:periodic tryptophan protein 1